ncbi:MAG: hypothetical protein M3461_17375 [Pseudomonadota bacterium]|nr:hypothetical protein [Pseudomonadota bacterium]
MDDRAWAGWAAVKMVADSVARLGRAEATPLLDYLKTALAFDGQKGVTMSFRKNGQLRQMLLIVEGPRIVGEAPVKGVVDPTHLDSLGPSIVQNRVTVRENRRERRAFSQTVRGTHEE